MALESQNPGSFCQSSSRRRRRVKRHRLRRRGARAYLTHRSTREKHGAAATDTSKTRETLVQTAVGDVLTTGDVWENARTGPIDWNENNRQSGAVNKTKDNTKCWEDPGYD